MKRTLIALGVIAAAAAPLAAQANPKIYGKLNITAEQYENDAENNANDIKLTRMQSNASRFGVRGTAELSPTLEAQYGIEWQVSGEGDATDLSQRNRFVGLKHSDFGTVKLGHYDSYLKLAQDKADLFNDYFGDMEYVIAGENRLKNVIGYESPKLLGGLQINVMTQTQEAANGTSKTGKNGTSAALNYTNSDIGLYASLSMENNVDSKTALFGTRESDNLRLVLSYKIADLTLHAIYGTSEASTGVSNEETGYTLGASYKLGEALLKVQYGVAEADSASAATQERTMLNVGVDYNLASKTKLIAFVTQREEDKLAANQDAEQTVIAFGLEHSF